MFVGGSYLQILCDDENQIRKGRSHDFEWGPIVGNLGRNDESRIMQREMPGVQAGGPSLIPFPP